MRRILGLLVAIIACVAAFAQADKVCGIYQVNHDGRESTVKVFKMSDGKYRAQVTWVKNLKNPDGSVRTDSKNPDKSKRKVTADKIVLIESVSYDAEDNVWNDGKIYDPTSGKSYNVTLSFKDEKTLIVKGSWGPFSKKVVWIKQS
ncbi:MAG: DUF2147 domain-containing protein [Bacteroidaceae bacterium]|nr:DUF2147 domain-containing protein [Bacteroidaceae bacterium]